MVVRSSVVRSVYDLEAAKSVMSEPTGELSRDDEQVICPDETVRS